ncbi:hypothetical protein JCM11491_003006 [Sporobolomyces phaffii]
MAPSTAASDAKARAARRVVRIIFFALLLDLLAFTMPLPLFPRIIDDYVQREASQTFSSPTLLSRTLSTVRTLRSYLTPASRTSSVATSSRFDLALLGGLLGSTFSFCQFLVSPSLGTLSDKYGRKRVLLGSMIGNLVSAALWLCSGESFGIYAASRIVGGLSEGNVQLSIAAISDVTTPATRSKSLALVGIAFSLAFTLGPSLGAYFASTDLFRLASSPSIKIPLLDTTVALNSYAVPAAITFGLLTIETLYLALRLPETRGWKQEEVVERDGATVGDDEGSVRRRSVSERRERLRTLEWIHFGFLFFFSGAEFTITFLTHNLFDFSNAQNGRLLGFIGILSSLLQGGYVRRASSTPSKTFSLALSGIRMCQFSLLLLSSLPFLSGTRQNSTTAEPSRTPMVVLYLASAGLAYVSATVVNSLNSLASLETDNDDTRDAKGHDERIEKGKALGQFRSKGQLGRALGPLFATSVYWWVSPGVAYAGCAIGTMIVAKRMAKLKTVGNEDDDERRKTE